MNINIFYFFVKILVTSNIFKQVSEGEQQKSE